MPWTPVAVCSLIYGSSLLIFGMLLAWLRIVFRDSYARETVAELFSFYKYGVGCLFLIELELSRLFEKRCHSLEASKAKKSSRNRKNGGVNGDEDGGGYDDEAGGASIGGLVYCHVGSFYLRMGILVFGSVAVVQHCMRGFVEFLSVKDGSDTHALRWAWAKEPITAAFCMLQMVLIFNFSISRFPTQTKIEAFGFMHVLVVNVLKWIRSAVDEYKHLKGHHGGHEGGGGGGAHKRATPHPLAAAAHGGSSHHGGHSSERHSPSLQHDAGPNEFSVDNLIFGEYSAIVGAFNTEFLIATAAVLFIVWLNINRLIPPDHRWKAAVEGPGRQKKTIRITIGRFSRRFTGLFFGVLLSIFLALGVLVHNYYHSGGMGRAKWAIEIANAGTYIAMVVACLISMVVMRASLDGKWDMGWAGAKDELLDKLLLFIGVAAEVLYCGAGVIGAINGAALHHKISTTVGYLLRIAQVFLQLHLIMDLNGAVQHQGRHNPGRQTILFLLWANLSLFFYYCVLTIHSIFVSTVTGQMPFPYKPIIALSLPFVMFFRFHSSAVLADIYKHHCSGEHHSTGGQVMKHSQSAVMMLRHQKNPQGQRHGL